MDAQTKRRVTKRRHEEDAKPWKNWKRKSAFNTFLTIEIPSDGYCDLTEFLKELNTTYMVSSLKNLECVDH